MTLAVSAANYPAVHLPPLHPGQREVANHAARFKVLACGRRWGKTRLGSLLCLKDGLEGKRVWWVAPSYPVAQIGWQAIKGMARQIPGSTKREFDRMIILPSGGNIQVKSADNPDGLRGVGLDFVVIDEAAFVNEDAWQKALRPALSDRQGGALIISTPNGRNWFYHAFNKGINPDEPEWMAWSKPSDSNPYFPKGELEEARRDMPSAIFEQEYLAEFLENNRGVFHNLEQCLTLAPANPEDHKGHSIYCGCDWGKKNDFTVFSIGCSTCLKELELVRSNQIDYAFQRQILDSLYRKWGITSILAESNAMGEPIIEELQRSGLPVNPFVTTAATKPPLIENLALVFQEAEWAFLADPVARMELEAYEAKTSKTTGRTSYGAPDGENYHDDTVIARALMVWAVTHTPKFLFAV